MTACSEFGTIKSSLCPISYTSSELRAGVCIIPSFSDDDNNSSFLRLFLELLVEACFIVVCLTISVSTVVIGASGETILPMESVSGSMRILIAGMESISSLVNGIKSEYEAFI